MNTFAPQRRLAATALPLGILALGLASCASHSNKPKPRPLAENAAGVVCSGENATPALDCAQSPAVAFDPKGRLVAAWEQGGRVYVSHSADLGHTFSKPVAANPAAEPIAGGAARPRLALSKIGAIYVAWSGAGQVHFSRSLDGGRTFAAPLSVGAGTAQAVAVNDRDYVYLAWVSAGALDFAYSSDGGRGFHPGHTITSPVCPDCAPAMKIEGKKFPVVLWRQPGGHALTHFAAKEQPGPVLPVNGDACKDCAGQSPALAVGPQGEYFAAWAAGGLYFSASLDHGGSFSPPARISAAPGAAQPDLLADGPVLHLAWTESDGQKTVLRGQYSTDAGFSWSPPLNLAEAADAAGQPVLVGYQGRHYAAWQTQERGFKLIALD